VRLVVQRVREASVSVEGKVVGKIGKGALVLFAVRKDDSAEKTLWLAQKLVHLRMFEDSQHKMNLSLADVGGGALIVSQFTLYGNCSEGRRPDFGDSAPGSAAQPIYEKFVADVKKEIQKVETGIFGAYMEVALVNDGPVTFIIDTNN